MSELFELFAKYNLGEGKLSDSAAAQVMSWDADKIEEFCFDTTGKLPVTTKKPKSKFDFIASRSMSGAAFPCADFECRLDATDELATFAALYCDNVSMPNPFFSLYLNTESALDYVRTELFANIAIAYNLRGLLESGLITYAPTEWLFCSECSSKFSEARDDLDARLGIVTDEFKNRYEHEVEYRADRNGDDVFVEVSGPEDLVEHGRQYIHFTEPPPDIEKKSRSRIKILNKKQKEGWSRYFVDKIIDDTQLQNYYVNILDKSYLTNRKVDFDAITTSNSIVGSRFAKDFVDGMSYELPVIEGLPVEEILRIREGEFESFAVYRDAITRAISEAQENPKAIPNVFQDIVGPEIRKIDLKFRRYREDSTKRFSRSAVISSGFVGIGLFSGFLPANIGEIVAMLGGFHFIKESSEQILRIADESKDMKSDEFYFLWKLKR